MDRGSKEKRWHGDMLVSHAFGEIDGYSYTNSLEAFESNYAKGHRTFEVDLYLTKDDKVVLTHDWEHAAAIQKQAWTEKMPPTENEFKSAKIYHNLTPLTYIELLQLMREHSDIRIITDTKYVDKEHVDIQFHYMADTAISLGMEDVLDRLIIQIYNEEMYEMVHAVYPFRSYIFTLYQRWCGDREELKEICRWCAKKEIDVITMFVHFYAADCRQIADQYGIVIYVHTENDVLKAKTILETGIRGIYTDSLREKDFNFLNLHREKRKQYKKRKRYEKIMKNIIRQEEMKACVNWIRKEKKEVVIFGAGTYGHQIYDILERQGIGIALFCDNKRGGSIDEITGVRIVDVDTLKKSGRDYLILLCVVNQEAYVSIEKQLRDAGILSGQIRGMREYIASLTVENLEIPTHKYDYIFFTAGFVIASAAFSACRHWHNGVLLLLVLFLIRLLKNSADWVMKVFGDIELRTIIYQLRSPLKGTGRGIIRKYFLCIGRTVLELFIVSMLYCLVKKAVPDLTAIFMLFVLLAVEMISLYRQSYKAGISEYISQMSKCSRIYEEEYVRPSSVKITFPGEKKNLIYIYLESMEMTNASVNIGGAEEAAINLIPHLTRLALENISFSNTTDYGGAQQMPGTGWTLAGILASTSGISFNLPVDGNAMEMYSKFLPKLESLGDILEKNGYRNYFMCGSDAGFAGKNLFFRTHGNYEIFDLIRAREDGTVSAKYHNGFWGMEDCRLYEYAKDKLTEISRDSQPFNFTMLTVDTHHTDGFLCEQCPHMYLQKYANVISCADKQIHGFLHWIQKQEWYKDTVVVITGDHLSMVNDFYLKYFGRGLRTVYNCFMNTRYDKTDVQEKSRDFWMADLFPSTLGALGAEIEGDQLGLGVNLFSHKRTLAEKMGIEKLSAELRKNSIFYKKFV